MIFKTGSTTNLTSRAGITYPSGSPELLPEFMWGLRRPLFVIYVLFFWSLCCPSFD